MEKKKRKKNDCQIVFLINTEEYSKLMDVCEMTGYGKSIIIRTFFRKYFDQFKEEVENGRLI